MPKKILHFLMIEIFYNGHLQSLGAASIVYGSSKLFHLTPIFFPVVAAYLLFQLIYIHDRYHDLEIDYETNKVRVEHLLSYVKFIPFIFMIFFILLSYILYKTAHSRGIIFTFIVLIMGFLYPIFFKELTQKIFLFKNFYVSSVFAVMTIYGNLYLHIPIESVNFLVLVSIYILIEAVIMQLTLDCKDIINDKDRRLLTLPVKIGKASAVRVIYTLIAAKAVLYMLLILPSLDSSSQHLMILVAMTTALNIYTTHLVSKDNPLGYLLSSGKFLLWAPIFAYQVVK